jgi:hypothetical protein
VVVSLDGRIEDYSLSDLGLDFVRPSGRTDSSALIRYGAACASNLPGGIAVELLTTTTVYGRCAVRALGTGSGRRIVLRSFMRELVRARADQVRIILYCFLPRSVALRWRRAWRA